MNDAVPFSQDTKTQGYSSLRETFGEIPRPRPDLR